VQSCHCEQYTQHSVFLIATRLSLLCFFIFYFPSGFVSFALFGTLTLLMASAPADFAGHALAGTASGADCLSVVCVFVACLTVAGG